MQVEALVRAGRSDEARNGVGAFRARSPGSLFLPTVESASVDSVTGWVGPTQFSS
jgi:hypothetical protein